MYIGRQRDRANHEHSIHVQFAVRHVRDTLISDWCRTQTQAADGCSASSCPKDPDLRKLCTSCLTILDDVSCISSRPIKHGFCSRFCSRSSEYSTQLSRRVQLTLPLVSQIGSASWFLTLAIPRSCQSHRVCASSLEHYKHAPLGRQGLQP